MDRRMPKNLDELEYDGLKAAAREVLWAPEPPLAEGAPAVVELAPNTRGRDIVIGDVHGQAPALDRLLGRLEIAPTRDRLIFIGDLIDRGEDSWGMLKWYEPRDNTFVVQGNHEQLMNQALDALWTKNWNDNGGRWHRHHPDGNAAERIEQARDNTRKLPFAIALEQIDAEPIVCVHAEIPNHWSWPRFAQALESGEKAPRLAALWGRSRIREESPVDVAGAKLCIHGHTPVQNPVYRGNCLWIDTGAAYPHRFKEARLTAAIIHDGEIASIASEMVATPDVTEHQRPRPQR